jgi:hypothetical protein
VPESTALDQRSNPLGFAARAATSTWERRGCWTLRALRTLPTPTVPNLTAGTDAGQNNVDLLSRNGAKAAKRCLRRRRRRNLECSVLHFDRLFASK